MPRPHYSRLKIGPTGPAYLFVFVVTLAAAFYTQANLMFLALGLLAGALVASLIWVWLTLRGIELEREPPGHGVTGEELVMRYRLSKSSWVPAFSLVITEHWPSRRGNKSKPGPMGEALPRLTDHPTGWVMHLGPGQSVQAQSSCWPTRRGVLPLSRVEVHSDFPFGLIRRVLVFNLSDELLVLPRLYRMTRAAMTRITRLDAGGYHQLDKEGGSEEFFALRDYRMGDSLKVIDWKHSAKVGKIVSRELTQPVPPSLLIHLDLSEFAPASETVSATPLKPEQLQQVDRAVDLAASLVCDAHQAGYRVGLSINGSDEPALRAHHSLPHRGKLLETLARLQPGSAPATVRFTGEAPTVIIRPGRARKQALRSGRRAVLLSGEDIEKLCIQTESRALLTARTAVPSRRHPPEPITTQGGRPGAHDHSSGVLS